MDCEGDHLSPILFNMVLDKIMEVFWENNNSEALLGINTKVKCKVYANDLALLVKTEWEAIKQVKEGNSWEG